MNYVRDPFKPATVRTLADCAVVNSATNLIQPTPMDDFYRREEVCPDDGKKCYTLTTDVYMLLNQKRLDRATLDAFSAMLDGIQQQGNDSLSALRSKCTDQQLLQFCKSRYIQAPSQLLEWAKYLESQFPEMPAELKATTDPNEPSSPQSTAPAAE